MESYYKPYDNNSLHRMFSMTKSLVSLGIGCLYGEHKLSLDDHIVDYFKDKLPQNGAYDYMKMLTIRDMLTMRTCHDSTTYKTAGITDWVGSFFTVKPVQDVYKRHNLSLKLVILGIKYIMRYSSFSKHFT